VFTQLFQRSITAAAVAGCLILQSSSAVADSSVLNFLYPELTNAMRAHDVVFARVLEEIDVTNSSPTSNIGKGLLKDSLFELSLATASHYHSSGGHLAMLGPYRVFESRATPSLISTIRKQHDADNPELTLRDLSSLTPRAVATLERGRAFVEEVIAIHVDDGFADKKKAVADVVKGYLSDDETSLSPRPKSEDLLSEHDHAYAYSAGFPQFSGLNWASQWLKLAALEIIITSPDRESEARDLDNALRLYEDKTTRLHGSLVSLPSDIPAIPSIAPNFYTVHPEASSIIDNLEALKVVIADILSHPDEFDRKAAIDKMVASYTNKNSDIIKPTDYMLFVLRGGIYNAGGPARGGMDQPDRNYSREVQENPHVSKYPMAK
jgi:hypothetical protein